MAVEDPKRAALLAEGMTEGEIDYMSSGGTKTEGLTPPADDGAVTPPEPAKPSQAEPEKPAAQQGAAPPEPPPEDDDPDAPPANAAVPYQKYYRDKKRLQDQLKTRDDSIAAERATTAAERAAEREKWARLDERLRVFQQAVEPPAQQPATPPDPEADPFAYMRWLGEQVTGLAGKTDQVTTSVQERDAATELKDTYLQDAKQFATRQTDFGPAYNWLMANRDAELQAAGYTDPAERMRIITLDERDIVARALTARQINASAKGPAEIIYGLARARGFQFQAPAPQPPVNGAGHPGNGAAPSGQGSAAPPTPSVTQQVEAIQRGQAASRSLSSAGGAPAPTGIDLAKLADMDDNEYLAWKSALSAGQRKELASLLGAPGR